jgi:hypothetical protein
MMVVEVGAWDCCNLVLVGLSDKDCCIGFQSLNYDVLEWKSLFSYCGNTTCGTSSGDTAGFDCEICGTLSAVEVRLTPAHQPLSRCSRTCAQWKVFSGLKISRASSSNDHYT